MTSSKASRRSSGNSSSKASAIPPTKVSGSSSKSSSSSSNSSSSSSAPAASSHRSSKKHQKDPAAPKRPLSAYMLFAKEKRAEVLQQQPELRSQVKEVARAIGELWRAADAAEKQHFAAAAAKEKAKYGQALAAYKQHK
ncbi:hypothetical protein Emag_006289 [Eimeria magna]